MKVRVNVGSTQVEADGATLADVFEQLALLEEIFGCHSECGFCKNKVLRHSVRENGGNRFYELVCVNKQCKAVFRFGMKKEGGGVGKGVLFPQWATGKGEKKRYKPNGGWEKYDKNAKADEAEAV